MICCGHERKSPFCPECGAKLREDSPIHGLLRHCRLIERREKTAAINRHESAKVRGEYGDPQQSKRYTEEAVALEKAADKWKQWGDALAELLKTQKDLGLEPQTSAGKPKGAL